MKKTPEQWTEEQKLLGEQFRAYSRQPFIDILSFLMSCPPNETRLREFADQYPDRWANACKTFATLSGYHDKLEITGNIAIEVHNMGDAQLLAKLDEIEGKLKSIGKVEDLKPVEYSEVENQNKEKPPLEAGVD